MASITGREKTTDSFICEVALAVNTQQESVLLSRLEAARQMYNCCLGEAMRRVRLIRQSKNFQTARKLKKDRRRSISSFADPQRKVLFKKAREQWEFSEYALHAYATGIRNSWIGEHVDSNTAQKLATRAFNAAQKVLFATAKSVRFKGKNQLDSVEGKTNTSGIRWKKETESVEWSGLRLKASINKHDPVLLHGLNSRVKYVRIVRRKYNGRNLFYAQLVCEGKPYQKPKNKLGIGDVGIDIGPSTIAVLGEESVSLQQFAPQLQFQDKEICRLQRKMDRSRRANNPDNYNPNGTIKKGRKEWKDSKIYQQTRNSKANLERRLASHRKSLHGEMVNEILSQGNVFKLEKLSYKAFQKLFGKSVGKRAPRIKRSNLWPPFFRRGVGGLAFVSHLRRKAESAGGKVVEFPTLSTKLSQTCQCGRVKKKKLSERVHKCDCGVIAQRDLYSAFLAKHIDPDTYTLQVTLVLNAWDSVEPRLKTAWRDATQTLPASSGLVPASFGRCPEVELVVAKVHTEAAKSQDVVAEMREPGRGRPARKGR